MPKEFAAAVRTSDRQERILPLWPLCYRSLAFKAFFLWNSDEPGFGKKTTFQALKKCFFPRCSSETQTSPALQKNNFSGSKKMFFFRAALLKLRQARLCKKNFSGSKKLFFPRFSYEAQTSPALQKTTFRALKNCFSRAALMKLRQARLCKKTTTFQALKKYFFPRCSYETQTSPALQKKQFFRL